MDQRSFAIFLFVLSTFAHGSEAAWISDFVQGTFYTTFTTAITVLVRDGTFMHFPAKAWKPGNRGRHFITYYMNFFFVSRSLLSFSLSSPSSNASTSAARAGSRGSLKNRTEGTENKGWKTCEKLGVLKEYSAKVWKYRHSFSNNVRLTKF